ncbi:nicotinate-nucleotide diphosphorylase [Schizopora paradoxa]|uniref:Nicotinate-nucleotide pyrophosphorylase [carboxylating] n=1 Tax=Schizopora paradoxa TaxID=27342 RepID=A0A0H2SRR7_9AGAM|nr:nicotinate-nucleotide diphosphorylase [Schizopora paradoxa]
MPRGVRKLILSIILTKTIDDHGCHLHRTTTTTLNCTHAAEEEKHECASSDDDAFTTTPSGSFEHLLPPSWKTKVAEWLAEDTPSFDYAGYVVGEAQRTAFLLGKGKQTAVLAGAPFFTEIFAQLECEVKWHIQEGETFEPVKHVATVTGKARHLLLGERVALNLIARCSGIATKSRRIKDKATAVGFNGIIAGTRKTTPGFRLVEKYGMIVGGIDPHRHDLSSMIMLKDNHVWSSGSITSAIQQARLVGGFSLLLDVEVRSESEADEAIDAGADIVMLDNMEGEELVSAARRLKEKWTESRKFKFESSGNITEDNLEERAVEGIDILSTSAVHQSVQHIDFSLKIQM